MKRLGIRAFSVFWLKKLSSEKEIKKTANLYDFYGWVDKSIENWLDRQKYWMAGDSKWHTENQ